ncbi:CoA pyrophosphatase [Alphaproteobacteria bacterium KMM 3653]|uniref:CoA pyrophosphatase n=1 Tax=Harenicola maris TaxID=2841044 RepID=A0AAP2CPZ3_9RHOB|nr:CoA pyrophosphatase [Harenicola maris]
MTLGRDLRAKLADAVKAPGSPSSDYDLNRDVNLAPGRVLRPAAVLLPIEIADTGPRLWLTRRSAQLRHHPGQIAFPGGKRDEGDVDLVATALREAEEEIALPRRSVEILGALPCHETVTGFSVTPILGLVTKPFTPRCEFGEVAEVFSVPLHHALDEGRFVIEGRMWKGVRRRYYAVPYGPYYIWGATARILRSLADRVAL